MENCLRHERWALRNTGDYQLQLLPPDFLINPVRSLKPGDELHDLYRTLVAGVTGAAMPAWDPEVLPQKASDMWALTYYVRSPIRMRGTPEALALKAKLNASAPRAPEKTKGPR
jgi:hypothetical protein